jgi:hypothetical protein
MEDLGVDGRIILKWLLKNRVEVVEWILLVQDIQWLCSMKVLKAVHIFGQYSIDFILTLTNKFERPLNLFFVVAEVIRFENLNYFY